MRKVFYPVTELTETTVKLNCMLCIPMKPYMKPLTVVDVIPVNAQTHRYCKIVRFPNQEHTDIVSPAFLHPLKKFKKELDALEQ